MQSALRRSVPRETIKKPRPGNSQLPEANSLLMQGISKQAIEGGGHIQENSLLAGKLVSMGVFRRGVAVRYTA